MSAIWYYIDTAGTQIGPVSADEVRSALRRGTTTTANLAWRDGLSGWQAISQLAGELGLDPPAAPPLPPTVPLELSPIDMASASADPNPYRAPDAPAGEGYYRNDDIVYAGFWRRWGALFLDQMIITIPMTVLLIVVLLAMGLDLDAKEPPPALIVAYLVFYLVYFIVAALYYAGMESSAGQATLGKRALGIKVTDYEGQRISFKQALGRWFAAALSYMAMYIGFLMAGFTERKRALHDYLANTLVVDKWAFTQFPERQQRGLPGCLIVFMVLVFGSLLLIPILMAIAISQYQDYVQRAQVSEASVLANSVMPAIAAYVESEGKLPQSNAEAGLGAPDELSGTYVSYVDIGRQPGRIEVGLSSQPPQTAHDSLNGKHLYYDATVNAGSISWNCHSDDLKQKWCPGNCTCTG